VCPLVKTALLWCPKGRFIYRTCAELAVPAPYSSCAEVNTKRSGENAEFTFWITVVQSVNFICNFVCRPRSMFVNILKWLKSFNSSVRWPAPPSRGIRIVSNQGIMDVYEISHHQHPSGIAPLYCSGTICSRRRSFPRQSAPANFCMHVMLWLGIWDTNDVQFWPQVLFDHFWWPYGCSNGGLN